MKKIIAALALALIVSGGSFAQSNSLTAGGGGGMNFPSMASLALSVSYERMLIPQLSVSINAEENLYPLAVFFMLFMDDIDITGLVVDGQAHWYPWAGIFHLDLGAGYGEYFDARCAVLTSGLGWKFNFGEKAGLTMNTGLRVEGFFPIKGKIFKNNQLDTVIIPLNIDWRITLGVFF